MLGAARADAKVQWLVAGARRGGSKPGALGVDALRGIGGAGMAAELHSSAMGTADPCLVPLVP